MILHSGRPSWGVLAENQGDGITAFGNCSSSVGLDYVQNARELSPDIYLGDTAIEVEHQDQLKVLPRDRIAVIQGDVV